MNSRLIATDIPHLPPAMNQSTTTKIGVIGALYFSQGIPNGFFRHAVPVVFRDSGISLEQIALFYPALYTPWMLKFFWSILVDRFHSEKQGKYRSWIIPVQLITAGVMAGLALWQLGGSISMFVLGVLLINVFSSMQDVSTDGHAISLLNFGERGWANAVQVGTFWLGYVVAVRLSWLEQCPAVHGGDLCLGHDPDRAEPNVRIRQLLRAWPSSKENLGQHRRLHPPAQGAEDSRLGCCVSVARRLHPVASSNNVQGLGNGL